MLIEDNLSIDSTMEDVLIDGEVIDELLQKDFDYSDCKFMIQKRSGGKLTIKYCKFKHLSVKRLISINNIDEDYVIFIKM